MILDKGVNPLRIQAELLLALVIADKVWASNGQELVVTSLNDKVHSRASLHYAGCAADLRTNYFSETLKNSVAQQLVNALGNNSDYDVVVEETHIHIEYQPKLRGYK